MVQANSQQINLAEVTAAVAPLPRPEVDFDIEAEIAQLQLDDNDEFFFGVEPKRRQRMKKPRGGPTGFAIFVRRHHDAIRVELARRQLPRRRGHFFRLGARMWRRLTDDQRRQFNARANQLRTEFNQRRTAQQHNIRLDEAKHIPNDPVKEVPSPIRPAAQPLLGLAATP